MTDMPPQGQTSAEASETHAPADAATPKNASSKILRAVIWVAIAAIIAAAVVCVIWVLIGDQNGLVGKAFLTIMVLAAFAGVVILDANLAATRPQWLITASMCTWVLTLIVALVKIWRPLNDYFVGSGHYFTVSLFHIVLIVAIFQLALLYGRLLWTALERRSTSFTRIDGVVSTVLVVSLALMLNFWLAFPDLNYGQFYWRIIVSITILAAVGTVLVPLVHALTLPREPRARGVVGGIQAHGWPTFADGITPLPVLPDGQPDWQAYYTGRLSDGSRPYGS